LLVGAGGARLGVGVAAVCGGAAALIASRIRAVA
jgi:putative intracellular protease/amidase